jgi:hypothetical protein
LSPEPLARLHAPLLVLLVLTAGVFLAALPVPYRLETDTAFQVKSILQWRAGDSPTPATLLLPDPADLGRDSLAWSNWWPPAFPFLAAPLAALGLPIAAALRGTAFLLFLAGSLGWLRLAGRLESRRGVLLLFAVSLAAYAMTLGGASSLRSTDLLSYAAGPWLFLLALTPGARETPVRLGLAGLALGASYGVRYSLFLVALPLLLFLAGIELLQAGRPARVRMARLAVLGTGFALPVVLLLAFNLRQSAETDEAVSGSRTAWTLEKAPPLSPAFEALSFAGAPGLALFQNDPWMTHVAFFSDARLPALRGLDDTARRAVKSALALPATLALAWGLVRARRRQPAPVLFLALLAVAGFYLAMTVLSGLYHFDYLANEPRLAVGFMPFLQLLALSGWLPEPWPAGWRRAASALVPAVVLAACGLVPLLFVGASFLKNDLYDRLRPGYETSPTGLLMAEVSDRDVPEVLAALRSVVRSPGDLVVLVGAPGASCAYVPWLELRQRALPMGPLCAELGRRYYRIANLKSTSPLTSSRPLRVVLALPRGPAGAAVRPALQARFPQARRWRRAPVPLHSNLEIYVSDLEVPCCKSP